MSRYNFTPVDGPTGSEGAVCRCGHRLKEHTPRDTPYGDDQVCPVVTRAKHPMVDGQPILIGQRVRVKAHEIDGIDQYDGMFGPDRVGVVTNVRIRCYGRADEMEDDREFVNHELVTVGKRSAEQVWISVDDTNLILMGHDIEEILPESAEGSDA